MEGKSSLFAKVTADKTAKTITLENYPGATVRRAMERAL